jgi:predicted transcriptional regulator
MAHSYKQAFETHTDKTVHGMTENRLFVPEEGKHSTERRDKIDIILAILEITKQPIKKTHILYTAKINFYQLSRYLDLLLNMGLIEEIAQPFEGYKVTEKGRVLLNLFVHE